MRGTPPRTADFVSRAPKTVGLGKTYVDPPLLCLLHAENIIASRAEVPPNLEAFFPQW